MYSMVMLTRLLLKEGFLVLFLILPPSFFGQLRDALANLVAGQPISIIIVIALMMVGYLAALVLSRRWSRSAGKVVLWGLPWLDASTYLIIAILRVAL
jgi:hypothetical protein